jgi:L-ascorbate metabolism protein UlaG (beta-lactamase superfamily)
MSSGIELTRLGHAAFALHVGRSAVLIDPWISDNPVSPGLPDGFSPDLIILTHGHRDHFGDSLDLARDHGCPILAVAELAGYCESQGATAHKFNIGGWMAFDDFRVKCVPAIHSSSVGSEARYAGAACGVVVQWDDVTLYHAGDTEVFSDMRLIAELTPLDLALLPIGGLFTMDPFAAVKAVELLRPRFVAGMHHSTFPALQQDAAAFGRAVEEQTEARFLEISIGQRVAFPPAEQDQTSALAASDRSAT